MSAETDAEALRERLSRPSDANLRVSESVEFAEALGGVLDTARTLTGAGYAVVCLLDDRGQPVDCLSSGLTDEQHAALWETPAAREVFDFLCGVDAPLLVDDLQGYLRERDLPELVAPTPDGSAVAAVAAPILHRGRRLGVLCAAERPGGFGTANEDALAMLAAQVALVVSAARQHHSERQARADLEAVLSAAPTAIVVFDARSGALRAANPEARRIMSELSTPIDALAELASGGVYTRADGSEISPQELSLQAAMASVETVRDEEMTLQFPNGRKMEAVVNAAPIVGVDGEVDAVVVTALDMAPLAEKERLRAEFLAVIGHELRAPLMAIKGSAATLRTERAPLDPAVTDQFHRIIEEQADHMIDLLSDLIDIVGIETGTLPVDPEPCEVSGLVEEARSTFAGADGIHSIRIDVPPDLPPVMADGRRVVQVIVNLLINAARYCHEASPIGVTATAGDDGYVTITVTDNGRGLTAESLPHLFAKFSRPASPDQGRDLGLGLAICKGIVEAHGGRIWAQSDGPGLGSRFTFTIPTADEAPSPAVRAHSATDSATRVLAIDDNPRDLKHIHDTLTAAGYHTTVTGNPARIAALVADTDPHIVVLDLMLPGADGFEVMRDILAARDVPVIFLSAYGQHDLIAKALQMGAADYIVKPFSPTELTARIQAGLRHAQAPSAPTAAARTGPPAVGRVELGDLIIDHPARLVTVAGEPVNLAPIEYNVLIELAAHASTVITHEQLLAAVWGSDSATDLGRMHTTIKNLRRKLGDNARNPRYIATVPRVGYRMPKPDPDDLPAEP